MGRFSSSLGDIRPGPARLQCGLSIHVARCIAGAVVGAWATCVACRQTRRALVVGAVRTGTPSTVVHVRQGKRPVRLTDVPSGLSDRQATRKRWYFAVMGLCLVLILLAWNLVRFYSTTAAVVMSAVAAVLPPIAAVVANWHEDN